MSGFSKTWTYLLSAKAVVLYSACSSLKNKLCFAEWNSNWDGRNHLQGFTGANNYFLIRHGQYHTKKNPKQLSDLGIEQAVEVGKYLNIFLTRNSELRLTSVISSNVHRAIQTSQFAFKQFQGHLDDLDGVLVDEYKIQAFNGLNECSPYITADLVKNVAKLDKDKEKLVMSRRLLDNAASQIFKRPDHHEERLTLVFAHANVNRYLLLHLLQLPCAAWNNFEHFHCGITWIRVDKDGYVTCKCFSDAGHFEKRLKTQVNVC